MSPKWRYNLTFHKRSCESRHKNFRTFKTTQQSVKIIQWWQHAIIIQWLYWNIFLVLYNHRKDKLIWFIARPGRTLQFWSWRERWSRDRTSRLSVYVCMSNLVIPPKMGKLARGGGYSRWLQASIRNGGCTDQPNFSGGSTPPRGKLW